MNAISLRSRACRLPLFLHLWLAFFPSVLVAAPVTILHSFTGGPGDGGQPNSPGPALVSNGTTFFGTTSSGGTSAGGIVFSINADGSNYQLLHSFMTGEGTQPLAGLTLDGSTLYGSTLYGTTQSRGPGPPSGAPTGSVFKMNTDGTGFQVLHGFASAEHSPTGGVTLVGARLYGTTLLGNGGAVYSLNTDGTDYQVVHQFGLGDDGEFPAAGLILHESKLFGSTVLGGTGNGGTVFSINADGTDYQVLHEFAGDGMIGSGPESDLIVVGDRLYGTTRGNDIDMFGSIFSIKLDGTDFESMHEFDGILDGSQPEGRLVRVGDSLWGTAKSDGVHGLGTVFTIDLDGTDFRLQHSFVGGPSDGALPHGGLVLVDDTLYGTTQSGGSGGNWGTIFSMPVPEPSTLALAALGTLGMLAFVRRKPLRR